MPSGTGIEAGTQVPQDSTGDKLRMLSYLGGRPFVASVTYTVGEWVRPSTANGFLYQVTVATSAASTEPSWPTTVGNTVASGGVTFINIGSDLVQAQVVAIDNRLNNPPKRYQICVLLSGVTGAGTVLGSLSKPAAGNDVYIYRMEVANYRATVSTALPGIGLWRASGTPATISAVAAADIPKLDTSAGNATLEVRVGATTGLTKANQRLWFAGTGTSLAANTGNLPFIWEADELSKRIRLTGTESLLFDQHIAGDVDDRYAVTLTWEET